MLIKKTMAVLAGFALVQASCLPLAAQQYPNKPIRLIVPYPPGGGTDAVSRIVAQGMSSVLNTPFVVENRPGATTNIGLDATAKAEPDGYTIGTATSNLAINPAINPSTPYNPLKDFAGITLMAKVPHVLVVNPSIPANTVAELIALAKAKPGKLDAAVAGLGTPGHLGLALFNKLTGTDIQPIPYQGAAPAIVSLLGNQTQLLFVSMAAAMPYVRSGKLRMLAVTSDRRSPELADVPTAIEAGVPGLEVYDWYGLVAPARMDPAQIGLLAEAARKVIEQSAVQQNIRMLGAEPEPMTPAQFDSFIENEVGKLLKIAQDTGIKVE